jgi:hypothetical protein
MNTIMVIVLFFSTASRAGIQMEPIPPALMNSSNKKVALGCTIAAAIPVLVIAAMTAGLFLKSFNDARLQRHLTISQAIGEWWSSSAAHEAGLTPAERDRRDVNASAKMVACPFAMFVLLGYFVPTAVALRRRHPQIMAIVVLNLFLGWTFLGWLGALIWALVVTDDRNPSGPGQVQERLT